MEPFDLDLAISELSEDIKEAEHALKVVTSTVEKFHNILSDPDQEYIQECIGKIQENIRVMKFNRAFMLAKYKKDTVYSQLV